MECWIFSNDLCHPPKVTLWWGLEITHSMKCCYTVCGSDLGSPALVKIRLSAVPVLGWRQRLPGASGQSSLFVSFRFHENPYLRKIRWTCVFSYTWTCTHTNTVECDRGRYEISSSGPHKHAHMEEHAPAHIHIYTTHIFNSSVLLDWHDKINKWVFLVWQIHISSVFVVLFYIEASM